MDTGTPFVSIAIPAYNAATTLPSTLDSLVAQSVRVSWEAVVVDDGSTDGTSAVLADYAARDTRIRYHTQANRGTGAALNTAFSHARGAFVAQLGADDLLLPEYVETMAEFVREHPGMDVYSCNAWLADPDGNRTLYADDPLGRPWLTMTIEDYLRGERYLFAGGALIRRELFDALGGFRPEYYCEDVDFWGRALARGARHIYCPKPLVVYNVGRPGQKTTDIARKCDGTIAVYEDLIASGLLTDEQARLALEAIGRVREFKAMELGARGLRVRVERIVGSRLADPVLRALHSFTWIVRPFRRCLARRRGA